MLLRSVSTSSPGTFRPAFPIPTTCMGEIALDAVKMGVDPRGLGDLHAEKNHVRGRVGSHPKLRWPLTANGSWCFVGFGSTREVVSLVDRQSFVMRRDIGAVAIDQHAALSRGRPLVNNHLDSSCN